MKRKLFFLFFFLSTFSLVYSQTPPSSIIFENVKFFNVKSKTLSEAVNVWIEGNKIKGISLEPIAKPANTILIDGTGKTLIPGLIDVHVHMVFGALTMRDMLNPNLSEELILQKTAVNAEKMLMRGFTSVRDAGGPIFPLKSAIDQGKIIGPRIWPSGATISQTAGHGDFRTPDERSRRFFGTPSRAEVYQATFIAD
ncbi:imidazolonepropionase-like amidohydrolase [Algoriphagus iocasae]|uniref:Imidazolonepropionase-like amidohydrolase n=1 Tax=Algoriphagus iocasae TaxID=1836499 RepID=A0A841MV06_9BACT|nr:amidohydrolase family protein [Algoriphagus iocasae]MBB6325841.1 imidazolonepropionase-like amidohydrolase [Algoriphagus iocasae]